MAAQGYAGLGVRCYLPGPAIGLVLQSMKPIGKAVIVSYGYWGSIWRCEAQLQVFVIQH